MRLDKTSEDMARSSGTHVAVLMPLELRYDHTFIQEAVRALQNTGIFKERKMESARHSQKLSNKTITLSSNLHGQSLDNQSLPWHDYWTQQQPSDPTESQSWLLYQRFLFSLKKPNSNWRMNFTTWALNQFWNHRTWEPKLTFHLQTPLLSPTVIEEILTSWA